MRFFGTFFNVVLLIVFITLTALTIDKFFSQKNEEKMKNTVSEATKNLQFSTIPTSPPYVTDVNGWEIAYTKDPQSISNSLTDSLLFTGSGASISGLNITGREWINRKIHATVDDLKNSKSQIPDFLDNLQQDYWNVSTEIAPNKNIRGIISNLPQSSIATLTKVVKKGLIIFAITTTVDKTECPCTTTTRVFTSDPIPTETILKSYPE